VTVIMSCGWPQSLLGSCSQSVIPKSFTLTFRLAVHRSERPSRRAPPHLHAVIHRPLRSPHSQAGESAMYGPMTTCLREMAPVTSNLRKCSREFARRLFVFAAACSLFCRLKSLIGSLPYVSLSPHHRSPPGLSSDPPPQGEGKCQPASVCTRPRRMLFARLRTPHMCSVGRSVTEITRGDQSGEDVGWP